MLGVHALIGVGEAVVSVAAVSAVLAGRADLVAGLRGSRVAAGA
jgi:cobalt/nickel transport system permease protein